MEIYDAGVEIYEIEEGKEYISKHSKHICEVIGIGRHAQNCSVPMISYRTINATNDAPPGQLWMCEESMFIATYSEILK